MNEIFVYNSSKQRISTILNDRDGSGKCFQCVAFFDAIRNRSKSERILVLCNDKHNLEKWHFHIGNLLETATIQNYDCNDTSPANESSNVLLATIDCAFENIDKLTQYQFECMVVQDSQLELGEKAFGQLAKIRATHTIYVTGVDLMVSQSLIIFF